MHRFPHHHFSEVHVRYFIHPHGVILELSGHIGTSDAMLGHIPSFSYRDDRSLIDLLQFSSLGREILYLLYWSLFL